MTKITRLSSMISGIPCTVEINGSTKNYPVKLDSNGESYIQVNLKILKESNLPMGEEVEI